MPSLMYKLFHDSSVSKEIKVYKFESKSHKIIVEIGCGNKLDFFIKNVYPSYSQETSFGTLTPQFISSKECCIAQKLYEYNDQLYMYEDLAMKTARVTNSNFNRVQSTQLKHKKLIGGNYLPCTKLNLKNPFLIKMIKKFDSIMLTPVRQINPNLVPFEEEKNPVDKQLGQMRMGLESRRKKLFPRNIPWNVNPSIKPSSQGNYLKRRNKNPIIPNVHNGLLEIPLTDSNLSFQSASNNSFSFSMREQHSERKLIDSKLRDKIENHLDYLKNLLLQTVEIPLELRLRLTCKEKMSKDDFKYLKKLVDNEKKYCCCLKKTYVMIYEMWLENLKEYNKAVYNHLMSLSERELE